MRPDELILVSVDDHVVEPPDMFARHVPRAVEGPRAARRAQEGRLATSGSSRARSSRTSA